MNRSTDRWVLLVATLAEFLTTFMASAVAIASYPIDQELHVSAVTLSWISLAYTLAAAALLMPAGRLADLYGRKRSFLAGMVVFTVLAFATVFVPSAPVLVLFRALQGAGTALLYACTIAMVTLAYPPERRGRALGLLVAGVYLGLTLGPVLGGVIADNLGWRWIFVFVAALGGANCLIAGWSLRGIEWHRSKRAGFDIPGSAVWALALTLLLLGFSLLPGILGWILAALGGAGMAGFVWWERRARDPILEMDLLRTNRPFALGNAATLIAYTGNYAIIFLMTLYLEYTKGLSAQTAGLVFVTITAVQIVFSPLAGRISDRMDAAAVAAVGIAICAIGLGALAFLNPATPYSYVVIALCVIGLGFAYFATPIIHSIMGSVDRSYAGVASATVATMRLTGQSMSMGLATLVLAVVVGVHPIVEADYPQVLTSVRVTFAIFAVLCIAASATALCGRRPARVTESRTVEPPA